MYSNGRLTAAHRDRLQRLLNKQEMSVSTVKQSYGAPQLKRGYTPPSRQRRNCGDRVQTPLTQSHRIRSSQKSRPATTTLTTRRAAGNKEMSTQKVVAGRGLRSPLSGGKVGSKLTTSRSRGDLTATSDGWRTKDLPLDRAQQKATRGGGIPRRTRGHSARSASTLFSAREETPMTAPEMNAHTSCFMRTRDHKYLPQEGEEESARSYRTQSTEWEETPMTAQEMIAHTGCFMRTRDNKYAPPGTPPIDDEEVNTLLNQMRLKELEASSKIPDRSSTATLLYGCRVEGTMSPDATPRPTKLMQERDAAKGAGGVNWISIVEHNQRLAARDSIRSEKMEKAVRKEFTKRLAKQRVECQDALLKEVEDREREKQRLSSVYQKWQKEDDEKKEQQLKRVQQIKSSFQQQLSAIEQRRHHETDKWKRRERRQVDALKASLADEQAKNEQKKAENRWKMMQTVAENNKKIELRRAEAMDEAAEESRLQKEYAAKLEKQEIERREAKAKIQERQNKTLANLRSATKSFKQQEEEDARRAEREQHEARERMGRIDRDKRERHERNQRHTNQVILRQREEKEAQEQQNRAEWRLYGDYLNKDAELYAEEEEHHEKVRRRKDLQQSKVIKEQQKLNEQRRLAERADMSENERLYNQSLLNDCKKSLRAHVILSEEPPTTERMATKIDKRSPFRWRVQNRPRPF